MNADEGDAFIYLLGFSKYGVPPARVNKLKRTVMTLRRIDGSAFTGVVVSDNARPRLIGNEIKENSTGGIFIKEGGDPFLSDNTIRDHVGAHGVGVCVEYLPRPRHDSAGQRLPAERGRGRRAGAGAGPSTHREWRLGGRRPGGGGRERGGGRLCYASSTAD